MAKNSFVLYLDGYTDSIGELTYEQKGMLSGRFTRLRHPAGR